MTVITLDKQKPALKVANRYFFGVKNYNFIQKYRFEINNKKNLHDIYHIMPADSRTQKKSICTIRFISTI